MDLFVINRYRDSDEEADVLENESRQIQKLKQKIEERKKASISLNKTNSSNLTNKKPEAESIEDKIIDASSHSDISKIIPNVTLEAEDIILPTTHLKKSSTEFKVLGNNDFDKKTKVKRVLPYWLSHPFCVSTNLRELSCEVHNVEWLNETLKSTLLNEGVKYLFPVQEQVIPFILQQHSKIQRLWPHDICISAPTGSGKTLSFVLPLIQVLMNEISHYIRALVVLPVQELAIQVYNVFKKYCAKTGLKVCLLSGSTPLCQEQNQIVHYTESAGWVSEVDIIVCTAGRLVEHIQNTEGFTLKNLKFLVIDEADRIMDHIQNDWLYHLDRHIKSENELMTGKVPCLNWVNLYEQNAPPHKLLFSATLSQDPEKLDQWGLFQPKLFSTNKIDSFEDDDQGIRKYTTPDELQEKFVACEAGEKPMVLYHFLVDQKWTKVLCFTNSSQAAHRLTTLVNVWSNGVIKAAELSAAVDRSAREIVLKKFTNSEINVLIGTDALARGIDIPHCDYVISYDPPRNIKTYIHRVGRTGRAGRIGNAVTFLLPNQVNLFKEILQFGGKSNIPKIDISSSVYERLLESYEHAIQETKLIIDSEINSKVKKSIALKRGSKSKTQKRKLK